MIYALVSLREAVDLIGVAGVVSFGAFAWGRLRRRDQLRRAMQKERQAEFRRKLIRAERERADALRCHGGVVR